MTTTLYSTFQEIISTTQVPVLTGPQSQGDLIIIPWSEDIAPDNRRHTMSLAVAPTAPRTTIVSGNGGNHHDLVTGPGVAVHMYPEGSLTVALLVVDQDREALLDHPEHGAVRIGPGVYVIRRQREQADIIQAVTD